MTRRIRPPPDEQEELLTHAGQTRVEVVSPLTPAPVTRLGMEAQDPATDPNQPAVAARTAYATRSAMVAESVQRDFEQKRFGGRPGWVLKVAEPDGPSTDGGLKARQALLLAVARGEGPSLHCGWMDAARMTSQLKSWDAVRRRSLARFGTEPELGQKAYETFLMELRRALLGYGLEVQLVVPDDDPPAMAAAAPAPGGVPAPLVAAIAVAALLVGLLLGALF